MFHKTDMVTGEKYIPFVTLILLILNILTAGIQHGYLPLLEAFRGDPATLSSREWWRLITPMIVDPDTLWVIVIKFIGLALVGSVQAVLLAIGLIAGVVDQAVGGIKERAKHSEGVENEYNPQKIGLSIYRRTDSSPFRMFAFGQWNPNHRQFSNTSP